MTESPFLPNTNIQYAWDSTSIGYLKECPRKYYYTMIEGWRSNRESVNLRFGSLYHKALEDYDKFIAEGATHEEALDHVIDDALKETWERPTSAEDDAEVIANGGRSWTPDHPTKNRYNLVRSIIWYVDHFREDPAKTVILANGKPAVELSFKMELDWGPVAAEEDNAIVRAREQGNFDEVSHVRQPYLLCGHLDRVVEYAGNTYVMDRKTTTSTISPHYFKQYEPDNQMSLYSFAAKVIYKTPVKGVIIDAVQIAVGFTRFSRGFTHRTDAQLEEWMGDLHHWLRLAEIYAIEDHWPMNDKSCHHYGGCVFREICAKSPEVRERFLASDFHKDPWNPLQVR